MSVGNDKRRSDRVPFKRSVKFGITEPISYGFAYDLSEEGISLYCKEMPRLGDNVVITLEIMSDSYFITVEGKVQWTEEGIFAESSKFGVLLKESPRVLKNIYRRIKLTKHAKH